MSISQLNGKSVLITGVAGFIGSNLAERVLQEGGNVIGVDNFITGQRKHVEELKTKYAQTYTFIEADVSTDPAGYLGDLPIDLVLHFASPASPPKYQAHPVETYLVNSMGTHVLLQFLKAHHPQAQFLFASTSEVYGDPQVHPQTEEYWGNVNPNGVRSCYDESKRMGETVCGVFHRDFGMDVRIIRIFNTYGPRIDLEDGRIVPAILQSMTNQTPVAIFGDGEQTRSFCYIDDLVEGILLFATHPDGAGETVNLGNPTEITINEAIDVAGQVLGHPLTTTSQPLPKDDPTRRKPEISKAERMLNWHPTVNFEKGLQLTLAYYQ